MRNGGGGVTQVLPKIIQGFHSAHITLHWQQEHDTVWQKGVSWTHSAISQTLWTLPSTSLSTRASTSLRAWFRVPGWGDRNARVSLSNFPLCTESLRGNLWGRYAAGTGTPTKCQRACVSNKITINKNTKPLHMTMTANEESWACSFPCKSE